jgi:hypothetical protein
MGGYAELYIATPMHRTKLCRAARAIDVFVGFQATSAAVELDIV